jgi:WD40 repeat protein
MSKSPRAGVMSEAALHNCRESTPPRAHPRIGLDLIRSIQRHSGWVYSVAVSPDDSFIASCSNDRTAHIFKASDVASKSNSSCGVVLSGHSHAIRCCAFNTSGSLLATASWDGDVRIWDVVTGACVRVLAAAAGGNRVYACAWTAPAADECETVAAAGGGGGACPVDFAVRLWKLEADGAVSCRVFEGHTKAVTCIAFDADGRSLVSCSDDHTVYHVFSHLSFALFAMPYLYFCTLSTRSCVCGTWHPAAAASSWRTKMPCAAAVGVQVITAAPEQSQAATKIQ